MLFVIYLFFFFSQMTSSGTISTVVGSGLVGLANAAPATAGSLYFTNAVSVSPSGDVYISDAYNTVRKVVCISIE